MKMELQAYYNFKLLSIKIGSTLKLKPGHRELNGSKFLDDCLNAYRSYLEGSLVLAGTIDDEIVKMPKTPVVKNPLSGEIQLKFSP